MDLPFDLRERVSIIDNKFLLLFYQQQLNVDWETLHTILVRINFFFYKTSGSRLAVTKLISKTMHLFKSTEHILLLYRYMPCLMITIW